MHAATELGRRMLGNVSYDDFVDKRLQPVGLTAHDFDQFIRFEIGNEQLQALGGPSTVHWSHPRRRNPCIAANIAR